MKNDIDTAKLREYILRMIAVATGVLLIVYFLLPDIQRYLTSSKTSRYKRPPHIVNFVDSTGIQFENASLDYHYSLTAKEKFSIYKVVLDQCYSYLLADELYNNLLSRYENDTDLEQRKKCNFAISIEDSVKLLLKRYWKSRGLQSKFTNHTSDTNLIRRGNRIYGVKRPFSALVQLTPIKLIYGNIIVGITSYSAPLAGNGALLKLTKLKGKWVTKIWGCSYIS